MPIEITCDDEQVTLGIVGFDVGQQLDVFFRVAHVWHKGERRWPLSRRGKEWIASSACRSESRSWREPFCLRNLHFSVTFGTLAMGYFTLYSLCDVLT